MSAEAVVNHPSTTAPIGPFPQVPSWGWVASPLPGCDHCWCVTADRERPTGPPHRKCCKCLALMAEQFIPALTRDVDA